MELEFGQVREALLGSVVRGRKGTVGGGWSVGIRREGRLKEEEKPKSQEAPLLSLLRRVEKMRGKKNSTGEVLLFGRWLERVMGLWGFRPKGR